MNTHTDKTLMAMAYAQAQKSLGEGGLPIGAVLADAHGNVIAMGHNRRVQNGDPTAHGEMDCLKNAGRRPHYRDTVLYTTLSPCMMCSGTIVQFGIPRVVVGENVNFGGNEGFLESRGVEVVVLDDADCKEMMGRFIAENPVLWNEDIAEEGE